MVSDILIKNLSKLLSKVQDRKLPPATAKEQEASLAIREKFIALAQLDLEGCVPSQKEWYENLNELKWLVINDEIREFLRWDVIKRTMSVEFAPYVLTELKYLQRLSDWSIRWQPAIQEVSCGHPLPYGFYPDTSANLIHHAYHIAQFEKRTGYQINDIEYVTEFGGGYGSMCRLIHNLGFKGKYVIYDFEHFSLLQEYFLSSSGYELIDESDKLAKRSGILCVSNMGSLRKLITDIDLAARSMFIATWSMSEAPLEVRESILPLVSAHEAFLIGYQDQFGEVNNADYFEKWIQQQKSVRWHRWEIDHLSRNSYLVGSRETKQA